MKILFLSRRYYPDVGGVEKHVNEISRLLSQMGHRVIIITESQGENNIFDNVEIIRIPRFKDNWFKKFHIWIWFLKNIELIKSSDIIHAHDVFYWYLPFRFIFLSKKCFITFHGYESYPISNKAIFVRKFSEIFANGNIIVGDFIKKWYHTKPNFIIYGGVNKPKIKIKVAKNHKALFFGRLDYHTGILKYAEAVELIKNKYPNFKFTIIGEGEEGNKLKKYNLIGFKNNIDNYIHENNIIFVSRYLSILEALIQKKLVFALYDNPVKEDYLKLSPFSKFIIIEKDPKVLAKIVIKYLENPKKLDKMRHQGYEWAKNQSWENIVEIYKKLWKIN